MVNMDFCVAEARTVLPGLLYTSREEGMCCTCPDIGRKRIGLSLPGYFSELHTKFMCPHPDCQNGSILDPVERRRHKASHRFYKCDICEKDFTENRSLTRHKKQVHEKEMVHCYGCNSDIPKGNKNQHKNFKQHQRETRVMISAYAPSILRLPPDFNLRPFLGKYVP